MGKTRKNNKYAVNTNEKMPLDEQITSGRVVRSKNKVKIRMRAEENEVRLTNLLMTLMNDFQSCYRE